MKSLCRSSRARAAARCSALALLILPGACDGPREPVSASPEPALDGARLVVGDAADRWSLLSVPRLGGTVEVRSLVSPGNVVSTGLTELPPSDEARVLSDGLVVLRAGDGNVHTYDPASDGLAHVGRVADDAVWADGGTRGLFYSATGPLLEISRDGVWTYALEEAVHWAVPVEGGVLVILAGSGGGHTVWLLRHDEDRPAETGETQAGAPGVVTAWGRRIVLTAAEGNGLVTLTASPIEEAAKLDLEGPVLAVGTSPSTHEIYVSLDAPPRLEAVNRFDLSRRVLAELRLPVEAFRSSLFGEAIVGSDGTDVWRIPVDGSPYRRLASVWRTDLPIGLPDGTVLSGGDAGVVLADPSSGRSEPLEEAGLDRWWLPVPWNPSSAPVSTSRVAVQPVERDVNDQPDADSVRMVERAAEVPGLRDRLEAVSDTGGPPPGFYAIVGSARESAGIRELTSSLARAGFATQEQTFPDEAGRTWYRGLVGPYASRAEAEAASRQLLRERRLEAWVTEIGARSRPEEAI